MFLDFLEKRSEEVDDTPRLTDEEKLFLKVFGIEEDQPAAAMKEATYFTCIKKLSEAVAKAYKRNLSASTIKSRWNPI